MKPSPRTILLLGAAAVLLTADGRADPMYNVTALTYSANETPFVEGFTNTGRILIEDPMAPPGAPTYLTYNAQAGGTITPLSYARTLPQQSGDYFPQHISDDGTQTTGSLVGRVDTQPVLDGGGQFVTLPNGGQAVNDSGQVATFQGGNAVIDSHGTMTNIGTVPGDPAMTFLGLNDSGQAALTVGNGQIGARYASQPAFYDGHTLIPLGTFGGMTGGASGINNLGDVIGVVTGPTDSPAEGSGFVSHNGGPLVNLGPIAPQSINDNGQIVGTGISTSGALLYQGGTLMNLNNLLVPSASGINLLDAYAINDTGQIVASGIAPNPYGWAQLFLLTPVGEPVPPSPDPLIGALASAEAPEPNSLALFTLIFAGLVAVGRRRGLSRLSPR